MEKVKSIFVEGSYAHELRIPEVWEFARLEEVIKLEGGSQPPKSEFRFEAGEGLIRLIQIRDYKSDKHKVYIPKELARRFVSPDDVMIGRYGPPIFQILRGLRGAYNVALMKAVPMCDIFSNNYLFRYLSNEDLYNYVNSASDRTAGQSGVNKAHLDKYPVAVPPLAEQQQIADQLDELLAQVDIIKTRLDTIPKILKRFRQSALAAAVSGKLTEEWRDGNSGYAPLNLAEEIIQIPKSWMVDTLENLINSKRRLCYGVVQPGDKIGVDDGVDLIRVCDINDGKVDWSSLRKISKVIDNQYRRSKVERGDILVTIVGAIGRIGFVDNDANANIARAVARISPNYKLVTSGWLHTWLSSPALQWWLENSSKEVARKTLNLKELKEALVGVPCLEEQTEIVTRVEQLFTYADQIEQRVKDAQARVNHLTQSILAKAFRGELTADWRAQNPELISGENSAEALLLKIQLGRSNSIMGKLSQRRRSA